MDSQRIVICLELDLAESELSGRASAARMPAREFAGWLGLLAAIDGLIASHRPEGNR